MFIIFIIIVIFILSEQNFVFNSSLLKNVFKFRDLVIVKFYNYNISLILKRLSFIFALDDKNNKLFFDKSRFVICVISFKVSQNIR